MILRIIINLAVFCFVCSGALVCFAQPGKAGGYREVPATDEQVVAAANFAVNNRKESEKAESLKLISIKSAKKQIVAGTNYSLCLEISDADKAEQAVAIVYQNLQQQYKLSSWSLEKCSTSEVDFKSYPAEVEKIKDLDRIFKLNIRNHTNEKHLNRATKEGVNFAGHFIVTGWLIPGPEPHTVRAIIDVHDGKMFFPPELADKSVDAEGKYCHPSPGNDVVAIYHADSRLLILNGYNAADQRKDEPCGIYYLEWTGTNFKQIKLTENAEWKGFEVETLDVADEQVVAGANFAVSSQKEIQNNVSLKLLSIDYAEKQIVTGGTNYTLCLKVSDADKEKQITAMVKQNSQQKYQLLNWTTGKCLPLEPDQKVENEK